MKLFTHYFFKLLLIFSILFTTGLYAGNDSCNGDQKDTLNISDTSWSGNFTVKTKNDPNDYIYFDIEDPGVISITTEEQKNRPYNLSVSIISCGATDVYGRTSAKNHTVNDFVVSSGDVVYVRIDAEGYANNYDERKLKFDISFAPYIEADLSITKTADKSSYEVGDIVTYTIVAKNHGPEKTDIKITDTLPASLSWISDNDNGKSNFNCTNSSNAMTCTGSNNINKNETVTITIKAEALTAGTVTNTANVESTSGVSDPDSTNNSANIDIEVNEPMPTIENADDVCFQTPIEVGTRTITPINSINDITDVIVYFDTSSLFNIPFFGSSIDDCSVDEGNKGDNCQEDNSGNTIGPVSIFNSGGWTFTLDEVTTDQNRSISTYDNSGGFFDFINDFFSKEGAIQATYVKDGTRYIGSMKQCNESAPLISDASTTISTAIEDGTNILKVTSSKGIATSYTIVSGNSEGLFSIDNYGNITVTGALNAAATSYSLGVTASNNVGSDSATMTITITESTVYHAGARDFVLINPVDTQNIIGNTQIIGNTVECVTRTSYASSEDYSNLTCDNTVGNYNNNNYTVKYIDIDGDDTTYNSSSATIELPSTFKEISWVGLYWQAHINNDSWIYYNNYSDKLKSNDLPSGGIQATAANQVLLKIGNNPYQTITARTVDHFSGSSVARYSSFSNITSLFLDSYTANDDIKITVANIAATRGRETGLGNYGAWTLVVVYKEDELNSLSKLRNNSVYVGYQYVSSSSGDQEITLNDFLLPKKGTIDSQMAVFAAEGEYRYSPDTMQLDGVTLGDPDTNNVFDARLSNSITRSPELINNDGIDIDVFDTSSIMTAKRDSDPDATTYSSTITLTSDWDLYFPSMVSFTTELYKPRVCYYIGSIVDKDNHTIFEHAAFTSGSTIDPSEEYTFNFWISNMKKDFNDTDIEIADKVQVYIKMTDFNYISESTTMNNIDGTNVVANRPTVDISDVADINVSGTITKDDLGEHINNKSTLRLGDGASISEGGSLNIATSFSDTKYITYLSLKGSLNIQNDATDIDLLDYFEFKASFQTSSITIGSDNAQLIVQCQDLNSSGSVGIPPNGSYNAVETNFTGTNDPVNTDTTIDPKNYITTKITNKPFTLSILSLDNTNNTTLTNSTGDVNVSVIATPVWTGVTEVDAQRCHDAISLSSLQTIAIDGSSRENAVFTVPTANKNASIRITYNLDDTPKSSCSRDIFAIRPEKFILTSPSKDIELLHAGVNYNFSLIAAEYSNVNAVINSIGYDVENAQTLFGNINNYKVIYAKDGSIPTPALDGTLSMTSTSFNIINGVANNVVGINFDNVGKVKIELVDQNWSKVDIDNGDTSLDCNNTDGSIGAYICGNVDAVFIPDHFSLTSASVINSGANTFTYLSNDLNMSAGISLTVRAENAQNFKTTNFNFNVWEEPVNIAFTIPDETGLTSIPNDINDTVQLNFTSGEKTISYSDTNTSSNLIFNYSRSLTTAKNPFRVNGADITVTALSKYSSSSTPPVTDLITGTVNPDQNVTFIYGRTYAPRQKFLDTGSSPINHDALIYYEAYCSGAGCDKTLLPNGTASTFINDPRWFTNTLHTSTEGTAGNVTEKTSSGAMTVVTEPTGTHPDKVVVKYQGTKGYPFTKTMESAASDWLIYDKYNPAADHNEFVLEFYKDAGGYVGSGNSTSDIKVKKSTNLNTNENKSWW